MPDKNAHGHPRLHLDAGPRNVLPGGSSEWPHSHNFWMIENHELRRLAALAERLYTEDRMDANEMRDAAQALQHIVENAIPDHED